MNETLDSLQTPVVLLDLDRLEANINRLQKICDTHHVELRPHIKTHKMVEVAKLQLKAGAKGLTCAKISEAEAMLPSGVRSIFIAHSLVDKRVGPRLKKLASQLDELILAVTSLKQAEALEAVLASVDLKVPVMLAFDTGLHREGARSIQDAKAIAAFIKKQPHLTLKGLYTHEGFSYMGEKDKLSQIADQVWNAIREARDAIDPQLLVWPGCSVTAAMIAKKGGIDAVRPGALFFGDLSLTTGTGILNWDDCAISILSTVVDLPEPGLALADAGSKVYSSDKSRDNISGRSYEQKDLVAERCNEEHSYLKGSEVDRLKIGERIRMIPAHVCTVINLANQVAVLRKGEVVGFWKVDARGCVQ